MIVRSDYRVRVTFRRECDAATEIRVLDVRACDQMQALDVAIHVARREYRLTPYDEVSATPETIEVAI